VASASKAILDAKLPSDLASRLKRGS